MAPLSGILSKGIRDQAFLWSWEVKAISISIWWWENCVFFTTVFYDFWFGWLVRFSKSGFVHLFFFYSNCIELFDMSLSGPC